MKFEQLVVTDSGEITASERAFIACHNAIIAHGTTASEHILMMCNKLKEMRDNKLYAAADFATFGEYAKSACNIEERQAYNYITIVEHLPQEFLQLNAKIGITKLQLLAKISESERDEFVEDGEVVNISVKALNDRILELEREKTKNAKQLSIFESEKAVYIKENKNKQSEIERLTSTSKEQLETLQKQIKTLQNRPPEVQTVTIKDQRAEDELYQSEQRIAQLESQIRMSDALTSKFSVYFDNFQNICAGMSGILKTMDNETAQKCHNAVLKVLEINEL